LRHCATAVVGNQIDAIETESVEKLLDHPCLGGKRDVLRWTDLCIAQAHEIECDTPSHIAEGSEDMAPMEAVQRHAMQEDRGRSVALLDIGNTSRGHVCEASLCVEI
jgi:hypothetical protein